MTKVDKTHAMRVLDANGVTYRVTVYDPAGAFHAAEDAAALLGAPPELVYKTLVVLRDGATAAKPLLVMVPAAAQVDLRLLAAAIGAKKLRMATLREAERLTGMQAGGISALGLRRPTFEVLLDEHARTLESLHVSAGVRGTDLELAVEDLVRLTRARFVRAVA
ncbi:MAG TPA: YbaK/EbsC family protein [Dehalococcoidia bacterium]|nr:YbaK/EbsC family protein [Dehalococcoidia bacterium]